MSVPTVALLLANLGALHRDEHSSIHFLMLFLAGRDTSPFAMAVECCGASFGADRPIVLSTELKVE